MISSNGHGLYKSETIPSTYHQCVEHLLRGGQDMVATDKNPFLDSEAYHVDARLYKPKGKDMVEDEDILTTIIQISAPGVYQTHDLVGLWSRWDLSSFWIPKKETKKSTILYTIGGMENHANYVVKDGASTNYEAPIRWFFYPKGLGYRYQVAMISIGQVLPRSPKKTKAILIMKRGNMSCPARHFLNSKWKGKLPKDEL